MNIIFTPTAWQQYIQWQQEDKQIIKRINGLIRDIDRNGLLRGIGKPEPLKERKLCSRRITKEHRLTYNMDSNQNLIVTVQITLELLRHTAIWNRFAMGRMPVDTMLSYGQRGDRADLSELIHLIIFM